ncbi:hypothetical protein L2E82_10652 [Cichorium intybus]|uniref:Uncharacterized protein n=1 Tax=Cichorium intybus TaxID=13427 RepID=A0ACB9GBS0_CICIN|nr:hypothetical protein L2E82_10652 [Cichorium intybus]
MVLTGKAKNQYTWKGFKAIPHALEELRNFIKPFISSKEDLISLETAATAFLGDVHDPTAMRTKVRRLYDIANVFSSMDLLEKEFLRVLESNSGNISEGEFEFAECICESLVSFGSTNLQCITGDNEILSLYLQKSLLRDFLSKPNISDGSVDNVCEVKADTDTDKIYAQASLQSVNSEKDVLPIPDFGMKPSRHPSEFFYNTLTPNDTSTHGGFPVPRRAAEKLFPQLEQWVNESFELLVLASHGFEDVVPK